LDRANLLPDDHPIIPYSFPNSTPYPNPHSLITFVKVVIERLAFLRRVGSVSLTEGRGLGSADESTIGSHEVAVTLDERLAVHPGHDILEESRDISVRRVLGRCELGNPDWLAASNIGGVLDVLLEVSSAIGSGVPVDRNEVDLAAVTSLEESSEPVETHAACAVGNSRSSELGLAGEGHHPGLVGGSGVLGRHVGLGSHVGFVEGHQVGGTVGDGASGARVPDISVAQAPQERDVVEAAGQAGAVRVPVVAPRSRSAEKRCCKQDHAFHCQCW
jgi:hypothetical protein